MKKNKITFFLMLEKGFETIKAVVNSGFIQMIDKVICAKDKNVQNDYYTQIWSFCKENDIQVFDRKDNYLEETQYAIAISWRWIILLQKTILIVLHDSLLPKYRGFAPLVNALIQGDKYVGVTALFATERYDEGDILFQEKIEITYPVKINKAISLISNLYVKLVIKILTTISRDETFVAHPQDQSSVTYSLWRDKEDYFIDWNWEAEKINRFVDAVGFPYDGAKTIMGNELITIDDVSVEEDVVIENRDVGKVLMFHNNKPIVVCKKGLIAIQRARYTAEGKSIFPLKKFRMRFK